MDLEALTSLGPGRIEQYSGVCLSRVHTTTYNFMTLHDHLTYALLPVFMHNSNGKIMTCAQFIVAE